MSPRPRFAVVTLAVTAVTALLACASGTPAPNAGPPRTDASTASSGPLASATPRPSSSASASSTAPARKYADKGDHAFAARLYGTQRDEKANLVLSPSSARVALSMAYVGAKGKTATQMADVLGLDDEPAKVASEMSATIARWNAGGGPKVKLRIANATWGDKSVPFTASWLDTMKASYAAPLQLVDFKGAYEPARKTINDWIGVKTEQKILGTLQPGDLDPYTRFVLVNATYFDGKWASAFDAKATTDGPFHAAEGKDTKVIQKAWIKADEKGTEAAAATVVIGAVPTSVAPRPHVFDASHPFLCFLRDEAGTCCS